MDLSWSITWTLGLKLSNKQTLFQELTWNCCELSSLNHSIGQSADYRIYSNLKNQPPQKTTLFTSCVLLSAQWTALLILSFLVITIRVFYGGGQGQCWLSSRGPASQAPPAAGWPRRPAGRRSWPRPLDRKRLLRLSRHQSSQKGDPFSQCKWESLEHDGLP